MIKCLSDRERYKIRMSKIRIAFVETNCKKNGPIKQTLNNISAFGNVNGVLSNESN